MSSGVLQPVGHGEAIQEERFRILVAVRDHLEEVIDGAVAAMQEEIPVYAECEPALLADVRHQVERHYRMKLECLLGGHDVSLEDLSFTRGAAMRRARAGFGLEDYINAFRVGQQTFWEAVLKAAGTSQLGHEAALSLATPLMRYCDFASTLAGHAYVEFKQHAVADADRERRDLLEHLLDGRLPARGPLLAAAQGYGVSADARMLVVAAVAAGLYLRAHDDAQLFWFKTMAFAGPLVVMLAVVGLATRVPRWIGVAGLAVLAVALAGGTRDEVGRTYDQYTAGLQDLATWDAKVPARETIRIDVPPSGWQMWCWLLLPRHRVSVSAPLEAIFPHPPVSFRADLALVQTWQGRPRGAVGAPVLRNPEYALYRLRRLPGPDLSSQGLIGGVKRITY